jgi:hypothetical protein
VTIDDGIMMIGKFNIGSCCCGWLAGWLSCGVTDTKWDNRLSEVEKVIQYIRAGTAASRSLASGGERL